MDNYRKEANMQIGKRLRESRNNLGRTQAEIAVLFGVSEEHYRKYESGATGLSADKMLLLYNEYGIDPTYLITGNCLKNDFDVEYYTADRQNLQQSNQKSIWLAICSRGHTVNLIGVQYVLQTAAKSRRMSLLTGYLRICCA